MSKNSNSPTQNDFEKNIRAAIGEYLNPKGDASKDRTMFRGAKLPEETLVDKIKTLLNKQQTTQDSQLTLVSKKIDGNFSIVNRVLDEMLFDKTEDINKIKQSLQQKGFDIEGVAILGKIRGGVGHVFSEQQKLLPAVDTKNKIAMQEQEAIQKACDEICSKSELLKITLESLEKDNFSKQEDALKSYKENLSVIRYDFYKQGYKDDFLKTLTETASSRLASKYQITLTKGLELEDVSQTLQGFPEAIKNLLEVELEIKPVPPESWMVVDVNNAGRNVDMENLLNIVNTTPDVTKEFNEAFDLERSSSTDSVNKVEKTIEVGAGKKYTDQKIADQEVKPPLKFQDKLQRIIKEGIKEGKAGFLNKVLKSTQKQNDQGRD